jgi:putative SOS response-associated peptidase YedK
VPFWGQDVKVDLSNINAKAEGNRGMPAFREVFQRRLFLVPVEWASQRAGS